MVKKYYLDTSIFIDYYEDRKDRFRPLGDWAHQLLSLIEENNEVLLISDFMINELKARFSGKEIDNILNTYKGITRIVEFSEKQAREAKSLARKRKVPFGDSLHAIIARDNNAVLVARDHHFEKLLDIKVPRKPEELI